MNNFVLANDLNVSWKISNYVEELHKLGTKNVIETHKLGTKNVMLKVNSNTYKKINTTDKNNNNKIFGYNICVDDISGLEDDKIYFEIEENINEFEKYYKEFIGSDSVKITKNIFEMEENDESTID